MLKLVAALIGIGCIALFTAVCICTWLPRRRFPVDCLLVLGARVHPDKTMSRTLERRCRAALEAWRGGMAEVLILCGGKCTVDPCPEAHVMRVFFLENGVPEERILMEDESVNTVENLRNARRMMETHGLKRAALVTSDYHLTRALWIARDVGLEACGVAAQSPQDVAGWTKMRIRESISWLIYFRGRLFRRL